HSLPTSGLTNTGNQVNEYLALQHPFPFQNSPTSMTPPNAEMSHAVYAAGMSEDKSLSFIQPLFASQQI
ncbi:MAG TPA: hypothetical protein K8V05_15885, partial [Butyricimonas virosa]|nr:hypothetical protein [Butyricimonas virosa]